MECAAPAREGRSRPQRPPQASTGIVSFGALKTCYDEAFRLIQQGLACDEEGKNEEAKSCYERGLRDLNKGLNVNCEEIRGSNDDVDRAKQMQQKMRKSKLQIEYRLQALMATERQPSPSAPEAMNVDEPPSYEQAMTDDQFSALGDSVYGDATDAPSSLVANATELYSIAEGVQIFFITPEGYVSAPSYPTALKVFQFTDREQNGASNCESPPAFLQVGDWYYPLVPGTSPVLQSSYGAYIFPDVTAETQTGSSVGLMLPDTATAAERQVFEEILSSLTVMRQQEVTLTEVGSGETTVVEDRGPEVVEEGRADDSTSSKISKGILTAAEYLSWGVGKGAEKAGQLIRLGSEKLKARLNPEDNPRPVDPRVQKGVQYVRKGTHIAVSVSSYLVTKLGQATMALAREAAPHIRREGEKLLPKSMKETSSDGKSKMDGVIEVAASGLKGFGTVFVSLEGAAKALGKNLTNETVHLVNHKYGPEAGQLTEHTMFSAGNIAMTAYNANHFGVKAIAKRAAKDTGKAVLQDIAEKRKPQRPDQPPEGARKE